MKKALKILLGAAVVVASSTSVASNAKKQSLVSPVKTFESQVDSQITDRKVVPFAISKIKRKKDMICMTTQTSELPAGAYTNWWLVFNSPENCTGEGAMGESSCAMSEMEIPKTDATAFRSASGIVGFTGQTVFDSCISLNEIQDQTLFGSGAITNKNAEIYLIVKWHGPAAYNDGEMLSKQLLEVDGGCDYFTATDYLGRSDHCPDVQVSIHEAP